MKNPIIENMSALMCINCKSCVWEQFPLFMKCRACGHEYQILDGEKIVTTKEFIPEKNWETVSDGFDLFKGNAKPIKYDKVGGPRIRNLRDMLKINGLSVNLGSGQDNYDCMINIDLGAYKPVHIVADLTNVPLTDESVELVVSNSVLEHIYEYKTVIDEVCRILKKGGYFYLCVPNACLRHHKYDYHRWTSLGLKRLLDDKFIVIESGACRGIAYSLITYVEALLSYKINNKYLLIVCRWFWRQISRPLFLIKDDKNEEYEALSQTIYILGKKL